MTSDFSLSRRLFIAGLAFAPATASLASPGSIELDRLIALNTQARGGRSRLRRLKTMDATLRIIEPSFTVIGRYRADRSGRMRIDVFADGKRGFSEGIDADGAWSWPGNEAAPKPSGDKARQALAHGIVFNLMPLFDVQRLGHRLTLVAADPPCLQLNFADGFETRLFLDPLTGHVIRRQDRRAYHPDLDAKEKRIESRASDFRMQDGIVSAWRGEDYDLDSGQRIGRTETLRLAWDVPVAAALPRTVGVEVPAEAR